LIETADCHLGELPAGRWYGSGSRSAEKVLWEGDGMIKCEFTARNFEIDPKVKEYAEEKIGNLDKYLPRRVRGSATATIMLENDPSGREDNRYVCEVVMMVSGTKMV